MKATIKPNRDNENNRDIYEELTGILLELLNLDLDVKVACWDWGLTFTTNNKDIYNEARDIANRHEGWDFKEQ